MFCYTVYDKSEYIFADKVINEIVFNNVLCDKKGAVLSGYDHFIGDDEKRRNEKVIHINFPYTCGNYCLFYKGTMEKLIVVADNITWLLNNTGSTKREKGKRYKVLIESLHVVQHRNTRKQKSKLNGINSLSTSCLDNSYCIERIKNNDSVCSHCYSATQQKQQLALQDDNIINGIILRNIDIPLWAWKKYFPRDLLSKFFRIESFGDAQNKTQAINYINFCKAFPRVYFAAWTKNTGIYKFAFDSEGKPNNLSFVVSSNKVNRSELFRMDNDSRIDHVFTVYDKNYIENNNININCGGRACLECIKKHAGCYFTDTAPVINEQLK